MHSQDQGVARAVESAATVILLRECTSGFEVFLLRRALASSVLGGAYVFPGGKVDQEDLLLHPSQLDRQPQALHAALRDEDLTERAAMSIYVAASRELYEEAGVLLAKPRNSGSDAQTEQAPGRSFNRKLETRDLQLETRALTPWSRWITPNDSRLIARRFDTHFFVTMLPNGATASRADRESTEGLWASPRAVLERYWKREIYLAPPQIITLSQLTQYRSGAAAVDAATRFPARLILPVNVESDDLRYTCYPGDEYHPIREPAFLGISRLVYRNDRYEPVNGLSSLISATEPERNV